MREKNTVATRISLFIVTLFIASTSVNIAVAFTDNPDIRLTWNQSDDWHPSIAQSIDGRIWVVWHSYRTDNNDIFYKIYDSSSIHPWSTDTRLTTDPAIDKCPSIVSAADGRIWVVWSSNRTGSFEIFCKTSSDGGTTWTADIQLTANPSSDDWDPSVMQAKDGNIWVVWVRNDDLYYKILSESQGRIVETVPDTRLTDDPHLDWHPSIMQAKSGAIWVLWDSDRSLIDDDIFYKIYNGFLWSAEKELTQNVADDSMPSIIQTSDNTIWIAWASARVDNIDIYYKTDSDIPLHDVAIYSVTASANAINRGGTVSIEVIAQNHGRKDESFEVFSYANSSLIGKLTIHLSAGQLYPITFSWNTSFNLPGKYTLSAIASAVPNETSVADNTFIDGMVRVKILGDIDSDGDVDSIDLSIFAASYGKKVGIPLYNPEADLDRDNDVDSIDLSIFAANYGKRV